MNENRKVILLIEDNPDDRELAIEALSDSVFHNEIIVARNGSEALDYLFCRGQYQNRNTREQPDLILLDLKLPKVDGFEVLRQVRASEFTRFIPTIILTSSTEHADLLQGYSLGANSYVRKPVDFVEFTKTVKHLFFYWLSINEYAYPNF
ncbi:response regulator [Oligoflexus tunisiensis]|uniref:response regulator n=1 Tax=Oligoflexus tunisiensis TaxID=708132 RepID=UPI000A786798|nr:response regulator [Oligoflexus tunisiensis]